MKMESKSSIEPRLSSLSAVIMFAALLMVPIMSAPAQLLFNDNFEQFANGTDLTSTAYTPASGPMSASVATFIHSGSPTLTVSNLLGSNWALFNDPSVPDKNTYKGILSSTQTNQALQITWKQWIPATNSGPGMFLVSLPVNDPTPGVTFNPPLGFLDNGAIIALTNGPLTNGSSPQITIGNWASLAGTIMTNTLTLNYPHHVFSYAINGQTLAILPLGPYFTNVVNAVYFTAFERETGMLGNQFAIDDVRVGLPPPATTLTPWARRVASGDSFPEGEPNIGLTLDTNNNCYVTGFFTGTNDFGGVTLTNQSSGADLFVAKFNSGGLLQWVKQAGNTTTNYGRAVGVDGSGNLYVTGGYQGAARFGNITLLASSGENFFLAKYNNAGTIQWVQQATGGTSDVYGIGLAADSNGNSYALVVVDYVGHQDSAISFGSITVPIPVASNGGSPLMVLVKYDSAGTAQWARLLGGSDEVFGTKAALDGAGNIYVRGTFFSTLAIGSSNLVVTAGSRKDAFVAKFDNSGNLLWIIHPQGGNSGDGGVAVDSAGNVYISGAFSTNINFGNGIVLTNQANASAIFGDAYLAKYDSSASIQWAVSAGGTFGGSYLDLALDAQNNIYAAGYFGQSAAVAKYSPIGTLRWTCFADGQPTNLSPEIPISSVIFKSAVDGAGNCFVTGTYAGTAAIGANILPAQNDVNFFLAEISPLPQLAAFRSGANFVLTWPTNAVGFTLESTTNLSLPNWIKVSPTAVEINGQKTVTNGISTNRLMFYRLSQ